MSDGTGGDVGAVIAAHVARTGFDDLTPEAVQAAKRCILDTAGVILAAGRTPSVRAVVEVAAEQGGREEATVLGFGHRLPAAMAAFANGAMGHVVDFDEYHATGLHLSTPTVPSALAMAERVGASGKDVVTAVALATDVAARLMVSVLESRADVPGRAWYTSPLFGYFTSTLAAGKVLGLDGRRLFDAMGIAFCQAGGTLEMIHSAGSDVGGLNAAWPNKCGILSALLAERGVPGVPTAFEGGFGFFSMFFGGEYDRDALVAGLGERFHGAEVTFKPWPACGGAHCAIDATLQLVAEHGIAAADVREIAVTVHTQPNWHLCHPIDVRREPRTVRDAKFSIPYSVAVAAAKRRVTLADFTDESIRDERIVGLAAKVRPIYEESAESPNAVLSPATVAITTGEGTYIRTVERSHGRWPESLDDAELADKFRECASYGGHPLTAGHVDTAIEIVDRLEEAGDVRGLTAALSGRD